jgi:hypothetical protein
METDKLSEEYVYLYHPTWLSVLDFVGHKILNAQKPWIVSLAIIWRGIKCAYAITIRSSRYRPFRKCVYIYIGHKDDGLLNSVQKEIRQFLESHI